MSKNSEELKLKTNQLLLEYCSNPSIKIRNKIVILNTGLVRTITHRISRCCTESYDDLEQIGFMGLIMAIERYVPRGNTFSTFAVPYIDGNIRHYLRDKRDIIKLPRGLTDLYRNGQKNKVSLEKKLEREVNNLEIAESLNISISEWYKALKIQEDRAVFSLDLQIPQLEGSISLGDTLPYDTDQVVLKRQEEHQFLRDLIGTLDAKLQQVVEYVYFKELSHKRAAKLVGVSPMTITRRLTAAKTQIRKLYDNHFEIYS